MDIFQLSYAIFGTIFVALATIAGSGTTLASDLSIEDLMSREDPVQDIVTICHIPTGDRTKAHDITVGDSVVPNHLAHGDRIGNCSLTQYPTITVKPPASCISTENGLVAYARVILTGFPIGSVIMTGPQSSGFPLEIEVQAETYSVPIGFYTWRTNRDSFRRC